MLSYFHRLGIRVDQEWLLQGYDERRFPELASRILLDDPPVESVTVKEIIDWMFEPVHPVPQPPWNLSAIGQPSLILYSTARFMIEGLFWLDATTSIHQHAFSGAFALLKGSSVHSQWTFTEHQHVNSGLRAGELKLQTVEVLRTGDVRPILAGTAYIHQLFHLEMPSVTIVVRTRREEEHSPQLTYFLPGLALDPQTDDLLLPRRLALLDGMLRASMGDVVAYAGRLLTQGDLRTVYKVLQHMARRNLERESFETLCNIARERHGDIVNLFLSAIEVDRREGYVIACRQVFVEERQRFFLALLLLMPDRDTIFSLLAKEYPGQVLEDLIMGWVREMSGMETIGIELNELNSLLFRCLLEGLDEQAIMERLAAEYDRDDLQQQRDSVLAQCQKIGNSQLFAPLFKSLRPGAYLELRDQSLAPVTAEPENTMPVYLAERRCHVRAMEPDNGTTYVYLKNISAAQRQFEDLLDADNLTQVTWLDSLRQRHRTATGVASGEGHLGSGKYRSNDDRFVHAGLMRDEVINAGLEVTENLDFQNSANPLIREELPEWLHRTGRAASASHIEVKGLKEFFDNLGPTAEDLYRRSIPWNSGANHYFPHPDAVPAYRHLSGERVVEAWEAVKKAASGSCPARGDIRDAIHALADYYHTLINGHLFVRVNSSLAMTEVNSFLKRLMLREVEHGHLDIFAFNLNSSDFRDYFEEFVSLGQHSILAYSQFVEEGRLVRLPIPV